jgi:hypothetical protein
MTTYYLANTVQVGTAIHKSGTLIDDAFQAIAPIQSAGGVLIASSKAGTAAQALIVQQMWRNGKSQAECDAAMCAAIQADFDSVGSTTAVNTNTTATNQNTTATNTDTTAYSTENLGVLAAKGTNYHAQFAAGSAIDTTSAISTVWPPRNVQAVLGASGANPVVVTIDGEDYKGTAIQSVLTCTGTGTYTGTKVFSKITRIRTDVNPGDTLDIQTGDRIGLSDTFSAILWVAVSGAQEAAASTDATTAGFTPTTVANGSRTFAVHYSVAHKHTQNAHNHTQDAHTHTQNAHNHTQDTHNHTQSAHTHALS